MFARIGIFSFGGGYAMLPLIFQSVQDFGVMSAEEFSNLVALSQVTPGAVAVNAATYVGFNYAGFWGALSATIGVALPSFMLIMIVSKFLEKFRESRIVDGVFLGIRPATVGLIAAGAIFIAETSLVNNPPFSMELINHFTQYVNLLPCGIFVCTIILVGKCKISPIKLLIMMGIVGAILCG